VVGAADTADVVDGGGRGGHGGHGGHSGGDGLVDLVDCGRDQGPGDIERKDGLFCSHIGSENTNFF